ncbi:ERAP1-like C-terminal domain-containing protein [Xanthomonas campestris]|nr:ERAP1-like C-terminal domain-containing protein [Xanthomonas campestris pv. plantaginis]MCC5091037.1 ERAP1-like C-terminal domain-containing protein [Xanthomonas campestris]
MGWDERKDDSAQVRQLRTLLIATLSAMEESTILDEAKRGFSAFRKDPASLSPDLRKSVLDIVARNANAPTWAQLHAMAKQETSSMLRDQQYTLLAKSSDQSLAQQALEMALTPEPGATTSAGMISEVSEQHPEMALDFALQHREQVNALVDSSSISRFYPRLGYTSAKTETAGKIQSFADHYLAPSSRRDADTIAAAIRTRATLRAAQLPQVTAWLTDKQAPQGVAP